MHLRNVDELRASYVMTLFKRAPIAFRAQFGQNKVSFIELVKGENFTLLANSSNISLLDSSHHRARNISFKEIEEEVDPNSSYKERKEALEAKSQNEIDNLRAEVETLEKEKSHIRHMSLAELLSKRGVEGLDQDVLEENLLIYLIRNEYIDEAYHYYISYFYEGNITQQDLTFLMSVKNQEALEFDYGLNKIEGLMNRLRLSEFEKEEILNHNLIDYLLADRYAYEDKVERIVKQLSNGSETSKAYIDQYVSEGQQVAAFVKLLSHEWPRLWKYVEANSEFPTAKKDDYLKLILTHADIKDIVAMDSDGLMKRYLSHKRDFLSLNLEMGARDAGAILGDLEVKFKYLDGVSSSNELFDYIYNNQLYEINEEMIELIVKTKTQNSNIDISRLQTANYTTIIQSKCGPLIEYIRENITDYIRNVFLQLEANTYESEDSVLELLNNSAIPEDTKEDIITKQMIFINDITDVKPGLWGMLLDNGKIKPTWKNILDYYQQNEQLDDKLMGFLDKEENHQALSKERIKGEKKLVNDLSSELVSCKDINDTSYAFIMKSIPYEYNTLDFSELSPSKVNALLNEHMLILTVENYELLKDKFKGKQVDLIIDKVSEYLANKDRYPLGEQEFYRLLSSNKLSIAQKVEIVDYINEDVLTQHSGLSDQILTILISSENREIEYAFLEKIIRYSKSTTKRVQLFNRKARSLDKDNITTLLNALGEPYSEITKKGPQPSIDKNSDHLTMVKLLKDKDYISSFKIKKQMINVNTKRV